MESKKIESLLAVMARLRDPKGGCPWDLAQDFRSLAPHTLEEAYEVADAIAREDLADLQDELGDLLLHVVFYAQMAAEAGHFDFGDVVHAIVAKLVRRHPHIFGEERQSTAEGVKQRWEEINAEEKAQKQEKQKAQEGRAPASLLDDVPANLPGLMQAAKLQSKAAKLGFDWQEAAPVLDKLAEELQELKEALKGKPAQAEEELGDLLFTCVNLARHLQLDADAALRHANGKFRSRFRHMEQAAPTQGLQALAPEALERLWREAKAAKKIP